MIHQASARLMNVLLLIIALIGSITGAQELRFSSADEPTTFAAENFSASSPANNSSSSGLVWQPLRATFRPLNRQASPPPPPIPSTAPVASALTSFLASELEALEARFSQPSTAATPSPTISTTITTTTTPAPATPTQPSRSSTLDDDEEQPTRTPMNRFRPTKPPSVDPQPNSSPSSTTASGSHNSNGNHNSSFFANHGSHHQPPIGTNAYTITNECFECICEATTSCNAQSRCQTSDVRHTRCGSFLISYDQWLDTGLSKQLVSREALASDPAADERAFYECVTNRDCAERVINVYMQRNAKDCDKDGRIDCYDIAAIHQGGTDHCSGESLIESQYWSDFNACFGFGR